MQRPRKSREISSSHGGEWSSLMMEAVRTSETSVDNHFTRQYNPEDSSELVSLAEYTDNYLQEDSTARQGLTN
jgi:hypothetical protein